MCNNSPYWSKVLSHFENKNYFNNGLTIPFLIGSRIIVEPEETILAIDTFVNEINNSSRTVTILKCGMIGEFVIGLLDNETNEIRKRSHGLYREIGNIVCTDQSLDDIFDETQLSKKLRALYEDIITGGFYSKNDGEWVEFTKNDIKRLNEIKK